ncbi:unnamed protein product [Rhizoctonia solani]|uniref:Transmembrane protein n=1 Tax=Rhizoctonia solani TaxID=456999 RepID=A0A8H3A8K5_9AGAM|nr:unnamed protein product [Rhizoctonia solani]
MSRLKTQIIWGILVIATWIDGVVAYSINTTIHDTNSAHVTYSDVSLKCNRWVNNWVFWKACESWIKPWTSGVYHSWGKKTSYHSSLNHQLASVTIEFQGTDVWVYGPPLSELTGPLPDYKICLYESYHLSSKQQCYQTKTQEAYFASRGEGEPVVIFARGQLQDQQHRIVISIADPVDDLKVYDGIKFSHLVYTTERPTPWPVEEDRWRYREVVIHDTHPLLSYSPPVSSNPLAVTPVWLAKVHTDEDGSVTSWHELKSHNEGDQSQWRVETKIKAGAVAIYGAPSAYIDEAGYSLGFVCVRLDFGLCETVDLAMIYANQRDHAGRESVLLWRNDALDPSRETHVSIRLVQGPTKSGTFFPFKSINYLEPKEYSNPGPLVGHPENTTVNHDDQSILYSPKHCIRTTDGRDCSRLNPWTRKEVGPLGSVLSYSSTTWKYQAREDPHITMRFRGSAVYLYGAPNAYASRPFAPQRVCINNVCRVIDVEQAYLHPPREDIEPAGIRQTSNQKETLQDIATPLLLPHPELEPVLIWSITGLDDNIEHTLQLAFASLPAWDNAEMTIVKIVYTEVTYRWGEERPNPPAPGPDVTYSGPTHPPYATGWTPLTHKPPPPFSIDPPPSGQSPYPLLALIVLVAGIVGIPRALKFWRGKTRENEPLLPGHPSSSSDAQVYLGSGYSRSGSNNASNNPSGTRWGPAFGSPPPKYSNAADARPNYAAGTNNSRR